MSKCYRATCAMTNSMTKRIERVNTVGKGFSDHIRQAFPDINHIYPGGKTLLTLAIENDKDVRLVEALVTSGADVNLQNVKSQTALMIAASCKKNDILQLLVKFGAKLDLINETKMTALSICVAEDFIEGVTTLVMSGADVNLKIGKLNETVIDLATRLEFKHIEEVLQSPKSSVKKDAKCLTISKPNEIRNLAEPRHGEQATLTSLKDTHKSEALSAFLDKTRHTSTNHKLSFETFSNLAAQLHKSGSLNAQDGSGKTLLIHSVLKGSEMSMNYICNLGADVNVKDNDGNTALMFVFISELKLSTPTLCKLMGQNPCTQNKYGKSALMYAFESNYHLPLSFAKLLLGQTFIVFHSELDNFLSFNISSENFIGNVQNIVDNLGRTHLMYALMNIPNLDKNMIKLLMGNQINAFDVSGKCALIYAVSYNTSIIETLITYGANPCIGNPEGKTAAMIAITLTSNLPINTLKALIGESIDFQDKHGKTVLMYALESTYTYSENIFKELLCLNPNVDNRDNDVKTALMYAVNKSFSYTLLKNLASGDVNRQDQLGRTALMHAIQNKALMSH